MTDANQRRLQLETTIMQVVGACTYPRTTVRTFQSNVPGRRVMVHDEYKEPRRISMRYRASHVVLVIHDRVWSKLTPGLDAAIAAAQEAA